MPVLMVRNNQPGPTVLGSDPKGTVQIDWAGKGDPMGDDVQPVPEIFREHPAFMRAVTRGILTIEEDESDPAVVAAIQKQQAAWQNRIDRGANVAAASLDMVADNDIITAQCVGPDGKNGQCTNYVPVKEKTKNDKPPLCSTHESLVMEYIAEDLQENGRTQRKWVRATIGARMRAQD